jgi:hypothetical protein
MFSCKPNLRFLNLVDVLFVDGTFKSAQKISIMYLEFMDSATVAICYLHFSCWQLIKCHMRLCSDIQYQRLQNVV